MELVKFVSPILVTMRSRAYVCGRLVAVISGSNPAEGMDVYLVFLCCVVLCRSTLLLRADNVCRGVLPCV
jgi:hypothetical protein